MYLNRVELIGFTGSDAETKTTPQGKTVTTFSIATKTSYTKDGERQQRSEWHRVQAWGRLGTYAAAFKKGSHVYVEGELRSREYETNGVNVRSYDIVANSIINLPPASAMLPRPPHKAASLRMHGARESAVHGDTGGPETTSPPLLEPRVPKRAPFSRGGNQNGLYWGEE